MLEDLTSEQYAEWFEAWRLSPWGGAREDYRAGVLASVMQLSNPWRTGKIMQPEEWFPKLKQDGQPTEGQDDAPQTEPAAAVPTKTPQQAAAELKAWVQGCGGRVIEHGGAA